MLPVRDVSEAQIRFVDAAEVGAEGARLGALNAVHCGGAEGHEDALPPGRGLRRDREGGRPGSRLEAASDEHGAAVAMFEPERLGGLHATYETPLWERRKRSRQGGQGGGRCVFGM